MATHPTRREFVGLSAAAGLAATCACSRSGDSERSDTSGAMITHALGKTDEKVKLQ